jgi:hypothetical protein
VFFLKYFGFLATFILLSAKSDPDILEKYYLENSIEFNDVAKTFLESNLGGIRINIDKDRSTCEFVGDCTRCPDENSWECSVPNYPQRKHEVSSFDEMLESQNFSKDTYEKYVNFLKKYHLSTISTNYYRQDHTGMVEFTYLLAGLRYESYPQNELI